MDPSVPPRSSKVGFDEILVRHGSLTEDQLQRAREEQKKWGGDLGQILVDLGYLSEELLMEIMAVHLRIPKCNPAVDPIPPDIATALGLHDCERHGVIAVAGDLPKRTLRVATSDPTNHAMVSALTDSTKMKIELACATSDSIHRAVRKHYFGEREPTTTGRRRRTIPPGVLQVSEPAVQTPPPAAAATPPPPPPPAAIRSDPEAGDLAARVANVERLVEQLRGQLANVLTHPDLAALAARVDRLEQLSASEVSAIRTLGDILVERQLTTREELSGRPRKK